MRRHLVNKTLLALVAAVPLALSAACGSDDSSSPGSVGAGGAQPGGSTGQTGAKHIYAMHYSVVGENDNRVSYMYLSDTLDVPSKIPISASREFYGYANSRAAAGKLLVSDEGGVINRYAITDSLQWESAGAPISFANFGIDDAGFWRQWFQSDTMAHLNGDGAARILWNPTTFTILGERKTSAIAPTRAGGWEVGFGTNRLPSPESWKGPIIRPFGYSREDETGEWRTSDDSLVAVYDENTQEEKTVHSVPCGELQIPSQDEQGNTYYSSWGAHAVYALYKLGPLPCVARFKPDGSYDQSFTSDLTHLTGGRIVGTFRYVREGKAIATVLHAEESGIDFSKPFDKNADKELQKHWRLWMFDLTNNTAKQVTGAQNVPQGFMYASFGSRSFLFPYPFTPQANVMNYEINLDASVTPRFESPGFTYNWFMVR